MVGGKSCAAWDIGKPLISRSSFASHQLPYFSRQDSPIPGANSLRFYTPASGVFCVCHMRFVVRDQRRHFARLAGDWRSASVYSVGVFQSEARPLARFDIFSARMCGSEVLIRVTRYHTYGKAASFEFFRVTGVAHLAHPVIYKLPISGPIAARYHETNQRQQRSALLLCISYSVWR